MHHYYMCHSYMSLLHVSLLHVFLSMTVSLLYVSPWLCHSYMCHSYMCHYYMCLSSWLCSFIPSTWFLKINFPKKRNRQEGIGTSSPFTMCVTRSLSAVAFPSIQEEVRKVYLCWEGKYMSLSGFLEVQTITYDDRHCAHFLWRWSSELLAEWRGRKNSLGKGYSVLAINKMWNIWDRIADVVRSKLDLYSIHRNRKS